MEKKKITKSRKEDWVTFYADKNGITKNTALKEIQRFEETFKLAFSEGLIPSLTNICNTTVTVGMKDRINPKDGKIIEKDAPYKKVTFKVSKPLKAIIQAVDFD